MVNRAVDFEHQLTFPGIQDIPEVLELLIAHVRLASANRTPKREVAVEPGIPDLEVRTISVRTSWPGATPQDVEKEILIEQEEYLRTVPNLQRLEATASSGSASIELEPRLYEPCLPDLARWCSGSNATDVTDVTEEVRGGGGASAVVVPASSPSSKSSIPGSSGASRAT